jgi:hypothetical protein
MLSDKLLDDLHRLTRAEKLRVVQVLVNDLASTESIFEQDVEYPIYTPYGNEAAAAVLENMLEVAKNENKKK